MNQTQIAEKTAAYLSTFLEKEGFILLKTEYVKEDGINYLRAYLDLSEAEREKRKIKAEEEKASEAEEQTDAGPEEGSPEENREEDGLSEEDHEPGIGINDCALVSRRLSKWLDKEDFIPDEYMLEVCSRGYLN